MLHTSAARYESNAAWYPEPVPTSSTRSSPRSSSSSHIRATTSGWEIVCPEPMGSATLSHASPWRSAGTKRSRGTSEIAASTRGSSTWLRRLARRRSTRPSGSGRLRHGRTRCPAAGVDGRRHVLVAVPGVDRLPHLLAHGVQRGQLQAGPLRRRERELRVLGGEREREGGWELALDHHRSLELRVGRADGRAVDRLEEGAGVDVEPLGE